MKILCVSGYAAWIKVSKKLMPSHHLFGIHEMVDHYEEYDEFKIRGFLSRNFFPEGGYVDFFLWKSEKRYILQQTASLIKKSNDYDLIYDQLNRCSLYLGILKKIGLLECKLLTILHHPPFDMQLKISNSDGYVFFNIDYKNLAEKACPKKKNKYFVNEWYPDIEWYNKISDNCKFTTDAFFIDNGKSRRDRETLIKAAESARIRVDYAGSKNTYQGYARSYCVDLKDDIAMVQRLKQYKVIVIPVLENKKSKIGPLGITSFLDCIALNMPIIASNNVYFANEIEKYNLGILYEANNEKSLEGALKMMVNGACDFTNYNEAIRQYSIGRTINKYSERLITIIKYNMIYF